MQNVAIPAREILVVVLNYIIFLYSFIVILFLYNQEFWYYQSNPPLKDTCYESLCNITCQYVWVSGLKPWSCIPNEHITSNASAIMAMECKLDWTWNYTFMSPV